MSPVIACILYEEVKDTVTGAWAYCADAFGVKDEVQEHGVHMLDEYEHDPSLHRLVADEFEVLTF